jgi:hypothetical protein
MRTSEIDFYAPIPGIPWVLRRLGCFDIEKRGARFRWGEVYWSGQCWFGAKLCLFSEGWSIFLSLWPLHVFLKLPRWLPHREPHDMMESWGAELGNEHAIAYLQWGKRSKFVRYPFEYRHVVSEVLLPDGTWGKEDWRRNEDYTFVDGRATEQYPYRYLLNCGEKQEVTATISVGRSTRVRRWLPFWKKTAYAIDIRFSNEVGERAGSWKGGAIGCGWDMKPGESAREALRRMERTRKFT